MHGNFEVEHSAYPIGYLRDTSNAVPLYKVTDMRSLETLDERPLTLEKAEAVAAEVNSEYRSGHTRSIEQIVSRVQELVAKTVA